MTTLKTPGGSISVWQTCGARLSPVLAEAYFMSAKSRQHQRQFTLSKPDKAPVK